MRRTRAGSARPALAAAALGAVLLAACGTRVTLAERQRLEGLSGTGSVTGSAANPNSLGPSAASGSPVANGTATSLLGSSVSGGAVSGGPAAAASTSSNGTPGAPAGTTSALAKGSTVTLGAVGTQSGIAGEELSDLWTGLNTWEAWVNSQGGVDGHPVRLITADDQGDPGHNAAAVRQLIQEDHVAAFVGSMAPLTFSAGVPTLEQFGIPALGGDSSEAGWFKSPMAFPVSSINFPIGRAPGIWGSAHLKQSRAAVFYVTEAAAAIQSAKAFEQTWKAGGKQVVVDQGVSLATPDYTSEVLSAQGAGADIVFLELDSASCDRFWDVARRQQLHAVYIADGCNAQSIATAHDLTYGDTYIGEARRPALPGTPATDELIAAANRFGPGHDLDLEMQGWVSGKLFQAAVDAAGGGVTTADILRGLYALKNETLGGLIPPESWPPGAHPAGLCGMVEFVGANGVRQQVTPNFVC